MRNPEPTDEQIFFALRQSSMGTDIAEICHRLKITEATFSDWQARYNGLSVTELIRLKQLEEENRLLKQKVAAIDRDRQTGSKESTSF